MKCAECGAETTEAASSCVACEAPTGRQPSVLADSADGAPGGSLETALALATGAGPPAARGKRLRVAGAIVAVPAVAAIVVACALPLLRFQGQTFSIFQNTPASYALEPLGVAILGFCASILMARGGVSGRRWLAAGMLLAFGGQTILLFWGYQFGAVPPQKPGSAGIVGMAGGVMLLVAGVLGAVGIAAGRSRSGQASSQGIGDSPTAF